MGKATGEMFPGKKSTRIVKTIEFYVSSAEQSAKKLRMPLAIAKSSPATLDVADLVCQTMATWCRAGLTPDTTSKYYIVHFG